MSVFASGKLAIAFCERCGRQQPYGDLKQQVVNEIVTNLRVCYDCLDIDHEQLRVGRVMERPEGIALQFPRPDPDLLTSRGAFGWAPVLGVAINPAVGQVRAA